MAQSCGGRLGPAGQAYGVVPCVDVYTAVNDSYVGITYTFQWFIRYQIAYSSGFRCTAGDGSTTRHDSGWQGCSGGSTGTEWTLFQSYTYNITVDRTGQAFQHKIWCFLESPWGTSEGAGYVDIPAISVPAPPINLTATRSGSTTNITVNWGWNSQGTYAQTFDVWRSLNGGSWAMVAQGLANTTRSWTDGGAAYGNRYQYRAAAWNQAGYSGMQISAEVKNADVPQVPTSANVVRNSDTSSTIQWTNNQTPRAPYQSVEIYRSIDGSGASLLGATNGNAQSFTDTTTSANHIYSYQVRSVNVAGTSSFATAGSVYNTPATLGTPVASRLSDTQVKITWTNPANTENQIELQRSTNAVSWSTITTLTGTNVTSTTDNPTGGSTFYYRVRAVNTYSTPTLYSAWSAASNGVITMTPPSPPTAMQPSQGSIVSASDNTIYFSWKHNSRDGSGQTEAELQYSVDGGTWAAISITNAYEWRSVVNNFASGVTVTWRVRTKGVHPDFSSWSSVRSFTVFQVPSVSIITPDFDHAVITDVPMVVRWSFLDTNGSQQSAQLRVLDIHGTEIYAENITGPETSVQIDAEEFLPSNLTSYQIVVRVNSTTSLSAQTVRIIDIDYEEPAEPLAQITIDEASASAQIVVLPGASEGGVPATARLGLYRKMPDGSLVSLGQELGAWNDVIDTYPPLDTDYEYIVIAYTINGLTSRAVYPVRINSHGCLIVNFGTQHFRIIYNRTSGATKTAERKLYQIAGSAKPWVAFGATESSTGTIAGLIWQKLPQGIPHAEYSTLEAFEALSAYHGSVVLRSRELGSKVASVECSWQKANMPDAYTAAINWTEVLNYGLAI